MTGGADADVFLFKNAGHIGMGASRDVIADFNSGVDLIDLQALNIQFNGSAGIIGGGTSSFYHFAPGGLLIGDSNGDGTVNWVVELSSAPEISVTDFIL